MLIQRTIDKTTLNARLGRLQDSLNKILCLCLLLIGVTAGVLSAANAPTELTVDDFKFDGPIGSQGAQIEQLGPNHFHIRLGHAPRRSSWANMLYFQIVRNASGNAPRIDVSFSGGDRYRFNHNAATWSYDANNWQPIKWVDPDKPDTQGDSLLFPKFEQDVVWFGAQVPMSHEDVTQMMNSWQTHPHATVHVLGQSLGGRNIYRLTITDPEASAAALHRWVHRIANEHPGEHNSQWRMVGMIDWLLSDAGAAYRQRSICHFILMMCPDGPANGWYRVNAQGVDMNRSYFIDGPDREKQAHEAYIVQKDFEAMMASEHPVTTTWSMHTWAGKVEPIVAPGPEFGTTVGSFEDFKATIKNNDPQELIKPLAVRTRAGNAAMWSYGPYEHFGITTVLCEGSGDWTSKQKSLDAGAILMRSIAQHYQ